MFVWQATKILAAASASLIMIAPAFPQTAQPVVPGYLTTTGCPSPKQTPCFVQNGEAPGVTIVGPTGIEGGISVAVTPFRKDAANDSGAITVGGSWQQVVANNPLRSRIFIQNLCSAASQGIAAAESMFLNLGPNMPTTTDGAIELVPCGAYDSSSFVLNTQPVWLFANTAGHKFTGLEW